MNIQERLQGYQSIIYSFEPDDNEFQMIMQFISENFRNCTSLNKSKMHYFH